MRDATLESTAPLPRDDRPGSAPALRHDVSEGLIASSLLREGPVTAQLLLTSGTAPRLLVAFAAGNSGAGLWFESTQQPLAWRMTEALQAVGATDERGRPLHGVRTGLRLELPAQGLRLRRALVGSLRVLRDFQCEGLLPAQGLLAPRLGEGGRSVCWQRDRLDGAAGYALALELLNGQATWLPDGDLRLRSSAPGQALDCRLTALTGDAPEPGFAPGELLAEAGATAAPTAADLAARRSLEFLACRDKFMAGSWRFLTYFGRDTLLSLRMLAPVLGPVALEAGLASVLDRLDEHGAVAHEEDIGEFAILRRLGAEAPATPGPLSAPIFDYKMVDDDFLLLPVVAHYLLCTPQGRARAADFLARRGAHGGPHAGRLLANARHVLGAAEAFARAPVPRHLVRLKPGQSVGDWRDSEEGLGGGTYAYSVNVALVPAALRALRDLLACGLLDPHLQPGDLPGLDRLPSMIEVWTTQAPRCFRVQVAPQQAQLAVDGYAHELGLPASTALRSLPRAPWSFSALALRDDGSPVAVLHSDFSFDLLFGEPQAARIEAELAAALRPFPAGLMTDAGLLVANAVLTDDALRSRFGPDRYHGAVVWSWQQAMMAAGIERQRARTDLPAATQALLQAAQSRLWEVIEAHREAASGELWSWTHDGRRFVPAPFGARSVSADESNLAQLWSTVYLAVRAPVRPAQAA